MDRGMVDMVEGCLMDQGTAGIAALMRAGWVWAGDCEAAGTERPLEGVGHS